MLPPIQAPGRRRLERESPQTTIFAAEAGGDADQSNASDFERRVQRELELARPDLLVSWFWTRRLPAAWLARARLGGIGAHPSLLPRHRGPNPYFAAIDSGDRETGVSIHRLTAEYDEGDVLAAESLVIGESDSWQLARALDRPSLRLLRATVGHYARGEPPRPSPQQAEAASWAPEPTGDALRVQWTWPSERVLRRIRALSPVPGLALDIEGLELFVTRAFRTDAYPSALEPGEAAVFGAPRLLVLRTGDGAVGVSRAVLPGEDDGPDAVLGQAALAQAVGKHLGGSSAGRVG